MLVRFVSVHTQGEYSRVKVGVDEGWVGAGRGRMVRGETVSSSSCSTYLESFAQCVSATLHQHARGHELADLLDVVQNPAHQSRPSSEDAERSKCNCMLQLHETLHVNIIFCC